MESKHSLCSLCEKQKTEMKYCRYCFLIVKITNKMSGDSRYILDNINYMRKRYPLWKKLHIPGNKEFIELSNKLIEKVNIENWSELIINENILLTPRQILFVLGFLFKNASKLFSNTNSNINTNDTDTNSNTDTNPNTENSEVKKDLGVINITDMFPLFLLLSTSSTDLVEFEKEFKKYGISMSNNTLGPIFKEKTIYLWNNIRLAIFSYNKECVTCYKKLEKSFLLSKCIKKDQMKRGIMCSFCRCYICDNCNTKLKEKNYYKCPVCIQSHELVNDLIYLDDVSFSSINENSKEILKQKAKNISINTKLITKLSSFEILKFK